MSRTYCYHCSDKVQQKNERSWWCETCQQTYFENAAAAIEAVITNAKGEVLVVTRALEPYKGELDFPGGFVDFRETNEEALYRELQEEIGLERADLSEPAYAGSYHMPYPWGKDVTQVIVALYSMQLLEDVKLMARDDVSDARFIKFDARQMKSLLKYRGSPKIAEKIIRAIES